MGMFDNLPGYIKISDEPFFNLGGILNGFLNKATGAGLTPAEKEANAFTAEREDIAWQRQMDASNTSYQRQVADMSAAGINPMMAVKGSGAAVPAATAGSSVTPGSSNLGDLFSAILGFKRFGIDKMIADKQAKVLEEEAANKAADTALKKQTESESRERERGARIVNDIKEATKQYQIDAAKLDNNLSRAKEKLIYKQMDEISVNMSKAQAETDTEYSKQALMAAEKCLKEASAWQIYKLTPALEAYYNAQSEAAKGAAAASFAKAAYDNGLINSGYITAVVQKAAADAGIAGDEKILKDIATAVRTGDWSDIPAAPSGANLMEKTLSGVSVLIDNLNPLVGILK